MERESFVFYRSFAEQLQKLPDAQFCRVMKHIFDYAFNGVIGEMETIDGIIFGLIKPQLDANNQRYQNGCKGAEFGKLGGRPRKPQENPNETPRKPQENPNETRNDNDNVNVNVNDNVNVIKEKRNNKLFHKKESFNESEIALMEETSETEEQPQKAIKSRKFVAPTLSEIKSYARERGREDIAEMFFDFFKAGDWHDSNGAPVKNWKQKFITWEQHNPPKKTLYAPPKVY